MAKLQEVLARIAREIDDEEARDEVRELREALNEGKRVTVTDIKEAISAAPPEERKALRELLAEELEVAPPEDPPDDEEGGRPKPKPRSKPKPERHTRPGRKSGQAYDWLVDDDGNVVRSNVAVIYSGEDEPDEVEMLPLPPADEEEEPPGGDGE